MIQNLNGMNTVCDTVDIKSTFFHVLASISVTLSIKISACDG